jgi:hypothetical protein
MEEKLETIILFNCIVTILILSSFIGGRYVKFQLLETFEKELIVLNVQAEKNKFTKEKFVEELKRLNIKHPHIVMAQSIIETGHWNSKIFKEIIIIWYERSYGSY